MADCLGVQRASRLAEESAADSCSTSGVRKRRKTARGAVNNQAVHGRSKSRFYCGDKRGSPAADLPQRAEGQSE